MSIWNFLTFIWGKIKEIYLKIINFIVFCWNNHRETSIVILIILALVLSFVTLLYSYHILICNKSSLPIKIEEPKVLFEPQKNESAPVNQTVYCDKRDTIQEICVSKPGKSYDRLTQELIGVHEAMYVQSYDSLFRHPLSIFPYTTLANNRAESMQNQMHELRETLSKENILLQMIASEMDVIINSDCSRISNLLSLIADTSYTLKYVFIGSQGVGKSQILNAITSLSLSDVNIAISTKSPIYGKMRSVPKVQEHFAIDGVSMQFEDLLLQLKRKFDHQHSVTGKEIELQISAPFVTYPIDFVDLPEYVSTRPAEAEKVIQMIEKYSEDPLVTFVMISDAMRYPDTEDDAVLNKLRKLVDDSRIIFIINNVNVLMEESHSTSAFITKIKNIVDYLKCSENNLPYLFTGPKNINLDEETLKLPIEKQVEKWNHFLEVGETNFTAKLCSTYGPYWNQFFKNGYPTNRMGIKAWKVNTAVALIDRFHNRFNKFVEEERQAPVAEAMNRINVPQWSHVMDDFTYELLKLLEEVAQNKEGIWERVVDLGGEEFIENDAKRRDRTSQCVNFALSQMHSKRVLESSIKGRELLNPIAYISRNVERGNTILMGEIFDLYDWMLRAYSELSNREIDLLLPKAIHHALICDHDITPLVISTIAKRVFSESSVRKQVARLQCAFRRIARTAIWLLLEERNDTDLIKILALQPKFQDFVNQKFDLFIHKAFERSYRWISKAASHIMDAQIVDSQLNVKQRLLQETFKDLYDYWPQLPKNPECIKLIGPKCDLQNNQLASFYELIRNEAMLHYSDRILVLAQMVTATHTMEWEDISTAFSLSDLRNLLKWTLGEEKLIELFDFGSGFSTAKELVEEQRHLINEIRDGLMCFRNKFVQGLFGTKQFQSMLCGSSCSPKSKQFTFSNPHNNDANDEPQTML